MAQAVFAGLSPQRPEFDPRSVHVKSVVQKVTLVHICIQVLLFSPVTTIPPMLHIHFHLRAALTTRANERRLEPSTKECSFGKWKALDGIQDWSLERVNNASKHWYNNTNLIG
jgi:hypothetical protein